MAWPRDGMACKHEQGGEQRVPEDSNDAPLIRTLSLTYVRHQLATQVRGQRASIPESDREAWQGSRTGEGR